LFDRPGGTELTGWKGWVFASQQKGKKRGKRKIKIKWGRPGKSPKEKKNLQAQKGKKKKWRLRNCLISGGGGGGTTVGGTMNAGKSSVSCVVCQGNTVEKKKHTNYERKNVLGGVPNQKKKKKQNWGKKKKTNVGDGENGSKHRE